MDAKHQTLRNYYLDKGLVAGRVAIALLWINGAWPYGAGCTVRLTPGPSGFRNILIESELGSLELQAVDEASAQLVESEGMYVIHQDPETGRSFESKLSLKVA
ncbi:TPA: hypothetical protein ACGW3M_001159 [Pseudomonas aeruginosa]|uniref:hypothetical protein n=1 Tax=Pseudomonas aeruginosa TaxID=287 RepID=UPI0027EE6D92|nr:hypothetical protein [Pseudomonas aeruginosa]ELJ2278561.1 hypothetical protein [Pseudomonas aeruginosa]HCH7784660.1 hypothetical protein [Pseudomonas aeruginosa]